MEFVIKNGEFGFYMTGVTRGSCSTHPKHINRNTRGVMVNSTSPNRRFLDFVMCRGPVHVEFVIKNGEFGFYMTGVTRGSCSTHPKHIVRNTR